MSSKLRWVFIAGLAFGWTHDAMAGEVTINVEEPGGKRLKDATVEIRRIEGDKFISVKTVRTNADGVLKLSLESGSYVAMSKHYYINGELNQRFSATFYPLVQHVDVSSEPAAVTMTTAKLTLKDAQISPTNLFSSYDDDKLKKARLALAEEHTGRLIELKGKPTCTLELAFPSNAVGMRGMGTYTPAAFASFDDNTLEVDTYYYNGDVKWHHDLMMLGTRKLEDAKNRLLIKDVKKKSGVEIPFEPIVSTVYEGRVTNTYANICFVSCEKKQPASVVFVYRYIDDPGTRTSVNAVVSGRPKASSTGLANTPVLRK